MLTTSARAVWPLRSYRVSAIAYGLDLLVEIAHSGG